MSSVMRPTLIIILSFELVKISLRPAEPQISSEPAKIAGVFSLMVNRPARLGVIVVLVFGIARVY